MTYHTIVSREEWLEARKAHLAREKEFTRLRDQLSAERRAFNFDYDVSFTKDAMAKGAVYYNFGRREFPSEEAPGISVFYRDELGEIFHTYSAYARGLDLLVGAYNYLDLVPKGRDEDALPFTMAWVRHHDRYGDGAERSAG